MEDDSFLDPLASLIPSDQHALFFPSFEAMIQMADNADAHGTPVLQAMEPRAQSAMTRSRYETQLGLPMSRIARLIGPTLIDSVALTGSDPYLRTGSDVAIIFEAKNLITLLAMVQSRVALAAQKHPQARPVQGKMQGIRQPIGQAEKWYETEKHSQPETNHSTGEEQRQEYYEESHYGLRVFVAGKGGKKIAHGARNPAGQRQPRHDNHQRDQHPE